MPLDNPLPLAQLITILRIWAAEHGLGIVFNSHRVQDHGAPAVWLQKIELGCKDRNIPIIQWADVAIYFLRDDIKRVMKERMDRVVASGAAFWAWDDFKQDFLQVCDAAKKPGDVLKAAAAVTLIGAGSAVILPTVGLGALNIAGFAATGVVKGTLAAGAQSVVYGGFTTGVFSALQSFSMTAVAASSPVILLGVGAVVGGTYLVKKALGEDGSSGDSEDSE